MNLARRKTARIFGLLAWIDDRVEKRLGGRLTIRLSFLAADLEAELQSRARAVHPRAYFDGKTFEIPAEALGPDRLVSVSPRYFDELAGMIAAPPGSSQPASSRPKP